MLKALKDQLKQMAMDPKDPFTAEVRRRAGALEAVHLENPLRQMILHLPDMIAQVRRWTSADHVSPETRRLHEFILAYLYNPSDFLPEKVLGLFGYLDDAYVVASAYQRTAQSDDWAELRPLVDNVGLSIRIPDWMRMAQELLPNETARIEQMIDLVCARSGRRAVFDGAKR